VPHITASHGREYPIDYRFACRIKGSTRRRYSIQTFADR